MKSGIPGYLIIIVILALVSVLGTGCMVVWHDEEGDEQDEGLTFYFQDGSFDAGAFVEDIWEPKVLPAFTEGSHSLADVLQALDTDSEAACEEYGWKAEVDSPYSFKVKGTGTVVAADTESGASTVELTVEGYSGERTVLVQIGPVIRKSAVRDSLDFISFGDFTNQLEYAGVSKELNFRIRDRVVNSLDRDNLMGLQMNLHAAFIFHDGEPVLLSPVLLETGGGDG